jgi:hypothetical protein
MLEITVKFDPTDASEVRQLSELADFFAQTPVLNPTAAPSTAAVAPLPTVLRAALVSSLPPASAALAAGVGAPAGAEVDAEGLPWDERIHSGARSKTAAGVWTRRRNVPDEHYERIKAELKGTSHQTGAMPNFGANTAVPPPTPPAASQAVPPPPGLPTPPAAPQPDVRVPPPIDYTKGNPFVGLVARVSNGIKEGRYTQDTISQLIASLGDAHVAKLPDFVSRHDLIPAMTSLLDSIDGQ